MKKILVFLFVIVTVFGGEILLSNEGIEYRYIKNEEAKDTIVIMTGATVIIEWNKWIQDELAKSHSVLLYNRGGYGNSIMKDENRRVEVVIGELELLLEDLGIGEDIILLGPSLGGMYARYMNYKHPAMIKAVVTVDSPISNIYPKIEEKLPEQLRPIVKEYYSTRPSINPVVDSELDNVGKHEFSNYSYGNTPVLSFYNTYIGKEYQIVQDAILEVAKVEAAEVEDITLVYSSAGHDIITNDKELFFEEFYSFVNSLD